MSLKTILFTSSIILSFSIRAQHQHSLDLSNTREGESVEYCHTHKKNAQLLNDPVLKAKWEKAQQELAEHEQNAFQNKAGTVYKIPIVFHLLHNGGTEKISDAQILDGLRILNRDFRRLNADANNVVSAFQGMPADIEIEFVLATIAPDGSCFSGITHTQSPLTNDTPNDNYDGQDQVDAIVNGNDVYQGQWDPSKYLNVFICKSIGGAAGYTQYPFIGGSMRYNGIFLLSSYIGEIGTGSPSRSRALTHEVGHWLNLPHTWGDSNNPGSLSNCNIDDGVTDTPNTIGVSACILSESSCGPLANVENYMDYSYCSKMFTPGQKARMRAAITSSVAGRNNLWQQSNLVSTGATGSPQLCQAKFKASNTTICEGQTIQFTDLSFHNPTSWSWTFPGGTPATSTLQNPTITYNTQGSYPVLLTVSNGSSSVSNSIQGYVNVLRSTGIAPLQESFEYTTSIPSNNWFTTPTNIGNNWEIASNVAFTGNKCVKVHSYTSDPNTVTLESTTITLDLNISASLSFKYAYTTKNSSSSDRLIVKVSNDCGQTWITKKVIQGNTLKTAPPTSSEFIPTPSEWKTATINSGALSNYLTSNFRVKFIFENNGEGNNLYIDDINIDGPVSINENPPSLKGATLYPNPTESNSILSFNLTTQSYVLVVLYNQVGQKINTLFNAPLPQGEQQIELELQHLSKGFYFIQIISDSNVIETKKIIIK